MELKPKRMIPIQRNQLEKMRAKEFARSPDEKERLPSLFNPYLSVKCPLAVNKIESRINFVDFMAMEGLKKYISLMHLHPIVAKFRIYSLQIQMIIQIYSINSPKI